MFVIGMRLFTKEMLPVVSEELINGVSSMIIDGKKGWGYFDELKGNIEKENPAVMDYIFSCAEENPEIIRGAGTGRCLLVYCLLKSMGDSLLIQGKQPNLPAGCYTREGLPLVEPVRFEEWENATNDISDDEEETVETLTAELWIENKHLAECLALFKDYTPETVKNTASKHAAILYLAMKHQSKLYLSGQLRDK